MADKLSSTNCQKIQVLPNNAQVMCYPPEQLAPAVESGLTPDGPQEEFFQPSQYASQAHSSTSSSASRLTPATPAAPATPAMGSFASQAFLSPSLSPSPLPSPSQPTQDLTISEFADPLIAAAAREERGHQRSTSKRTYGDAFAYNQKYVVSFIMDPM